MQTKLIDILQREFAHFPEGKNVPVRQSRHYYDFYCLLISETKNIAINNLELLEKVVAHNSIYFKSAWANYNTAIKGTLKIVPEKTVLNTMAKDYSNMKEMFFGDIPRWNEIIHQFQQFEKEFNELIS